MNDSLSRWLEVATRNINPISHARIRAEFEAHVQDAMNAHLAMGQNPDQAMHNAILELGDPTHANQEFLRTHLTTSELKRLERLFGQHWVQSVLVGGLGVLLHVQGSPWLGAAYFVLGIELFVRVWVMRHRHWLRLSLLLRPVLLALVFAGFAAHISTVKSHDVWMLLAVSAFWLAASVWWWHNYAGIYRKLTVHQS